MVRAALFLNSAAFVADELSREAQIFQVEEQQTPVVRDLEDHREHALLHIVQIEQPAKKKRAQVGDRGAHRVSPLTKDVPAIESSPLTQTPRIPGL
jgi:hypothetical protein